MSERLQAITMPRWGMTMTEGTVANWLFDEGSRIAPEDEIVEIETTKITNVMEAGRSGLLRRIVVPAGSTVPVGAVIAVLADEDVPDHEIENFVAERAASAGEGATAVATQPRRVEAGDRTMNVLSLGSGNATAMVLLHGFGGDLNTWLFNLTDLAQNRPVHAIDLPAHGGSPPQLKVGDLNDLADAVRATLQALGVATAHLIGHSLGGAIAIRLASNSPDLVRSLTLIAPVGFGERVGEDYIEAYLAADRRKSIKDVLSKLFADPSAVSRDMVEGVQRAKRVDGVSEGLRLIADNVLPGGRQADHLRPSLEDLNKPTLLIWGKEDRILEPPSDVPAGSRFESVTGAGHMPHMEQAARVNRLIVEHAEAAEE